MNYHDKMLSFFDQKFIDNEVKKMNELSPHINKTRDDIKEIINLTYEQGIRTGLLLCLRAWIEELEKVVNHQTLDEDDYAESLKNCDECKG